MAKPLLLIVDPGVETREEQGAAEFARAWPGDVRVLVSVLDDDGPRPGEDYGAAAIVILGSKASVEDEFGWLASLSQWLKPIIQGEVVKPVFGICFGHQLIAHLAGASVGFLHEDHSKSVGMRTTTFTGGRLLPAGTSMKVLASHAEEARDVPPGFVTVATRAGSVRDAFEHHSLPIFSVQFHPEGRELFASRLGIEPSSVDAGFVAGSRRLIEAFCAYAYDYVTTHSEM